MHKKGLLSVCAVLLAIMLAIPAVPALAENNAYVKDTSSGKINLRSGPATQYRVLAALAPYTPFEVVDVVGKWAHVKLSAPTAEGVTEGYMYTDYVAYYAPSQYVPPVSEAVPLYDNSYPAPTITENTTMYIYTGNSGRLNLREYPSQDSRSLGLYANGTAVTALNRSGSWAYVYVNGMYGYMMLSYLTTNPYIPVQPTAQPVFPSYQAVTKYIYTGNSGKLHLREYASQNSRSLGLFPNGTQVQAIDMLNGWSYVSFGGYTGYMMTKYLTTMQPIVTATPYNPGGYTLMYVCIANGHVSLRAEMSDSSSALGNYANGTPVYVIYNFGTWAYVYVGGQNGYMKMSWLGTSPYSPTPTAVPHPVNPIGTAVVQHPNGSFVYLRSSRSTADLSNVLAKVPSGAVVLVYQKDEWYSLISYNGVTGYMVSGYLYSGGVAPSPVVTSVPSVKPVVPAGSVIGIGVVWHPNGYGSYVNLRYSRSTEDSSNILLQVPYGAKVDVMEQSGNWTKVRYNGTVGYMVSDYVYLDQLTTPSPSATEVPPSVPSFPLTPATPITPVVTEAPSIPSFPLLPATPTVTAAPSYPDLSGNQRIVRNENSTFVYLRSSKDSSSSSNIIAKVPNGTVVEVLMFGQWWSAVRVGKVQGYMISSYLKTE